MVALVSLALIYPFKIIRSMAGSLSVFYIERNMNPVMRREPATFDLDPRACVQTAD